MGVLNDSLEWDHLERFQEKRASSTLQTETHRILKSKNISPRDLKAVITVAGPGFYTGLRLSEGFADVLTFFGVPHYSFYSYDVPFWAGHESGTWMTKAYRGEYFFCEWKGEKKTISLIEAKDLEQYMQGLSQVFIHSPAALDEKSRALVNSSQETIEIIKNHPQKVFHRILSEKSKRESYYFRAPEDEFRVSP